MTDENTDTSAQAQIAAAAVAAPAAAPAAPAAPAVVVVAAAPVAAQVEAPAPDLIVKLETILAALGHELPVFWDEAVALAKKAI